MATGSLVVYPTDFSEHSTVALPWVRRMAGELGADIRCVHVVEEPQIYASLDMGPIAVPSVRELVRAAEIRLDDFIKKNLQAFGKAPRASVLVGRPAAEIVSDAREHGADLIVMATHGHGGVRHLLLGSTTEAVLRQATCPVLSIRVSPD
ncbi:MAG: universal stress protein [Gammaproteobacteria bacterium PRO9]|nr:universal stress protein [Gammaproteobacteria bacterium PRO9]